MDARSALRETLRYVSTPALHTFITEEQKALLLASARPARLPPLRRPWAEKFWGKHGKQVGAWR